MRWETNWKIRSASPTTTCHSMPWCAVLKGMCWKCSASRCQNRCSRSGMCWTETWRVSQIFAWQGCDYVRPAEAGRKMHTSDMRVLIFLLRHVKAFLDRSIGFLVQQAEHHDGQRPQDEARDNLVQPQANEVLPHHHGDRTDQHTGQSAVAGHALP